MFFAFCSNRQAETIKRLHGSVGEEISWPDLDYVTSKLLRMCWGGPVSV